jgi:hypothetical protein
VDPPHSLGAGLGARDVQHRVRGVEADGLEPAGGEHQREGAGPAAGVHHAAGAELFRDPHVDVEIAPIRIERVVDRRQTWVVEDVVALQRAYIPIAWYPEST